MIVNKKGQLIIASGSSHATKALDFSIAGFIVTAVASLCIILRIDNMLILSGGPILAGILFIVAYAYSNHDFATQKATLLASICTMSTGFLIGVTWNAYH